MYTEIMVVSKVRLCKPVCEGWHSFVCLACAVLEVGQNCLRRSLKVRICEISGSMLV